MKNYQTIECESTKILSYDIDEEEGLITFYANLVPLVTWVVEDEDSILNCIEDFKNILDLGYKIGIAEGVY
jgi:hypothetical protein